MRIHLLDSSSLHVETELSHYQVWSGGRTSNEKIFWTGSLIIMCTPNRTDPKLKSLEVDADSRPWTIRPQLKSFLPPVIPKAIHTITSRPSSTSNASEFAPKSTKLYTVLRQLPDSAPHCLQNCVYIHVYVKPHALIVQELCESPGPSWAVRPNEPSGFRGRKAILNYASALVSACP